MGEHSDILFFTEPQFFNTILFLYKSPLIQDANMMFFSKKKGRKMLFKAVLGNQEWKFSLLFNHGDI